MAGFGDNDGVHVLSLADAFEVDERVDEVSRAPHPGQGDIFLSHAIWPRKSGPSKNRSRRGGRSNSFREIIR